MALTVLVPLASDPARAQPSCEPPDALVVSLQGTVELRRVGTDVWQPAALNGPLCLGDTLRVGRASRAALALANDSTLRLDQRTTLQLRGTVEERRSLLDLVVGAVYFFSHRPRALEVGTPFVNAAAEGTEFLVRVGDDRAEVVMLDGQVLLQNPEGELRIVSGEAAVIPEGEAPAPSIVVRARDAVAWALYYPPILTALAGRAARPEALPPGLQTAIERVGENDYAGALDALEAVPDAARDARYDTYLAGVLLNVGRVDEAAAAIERALALDPQAGEALAQRAIIHVVQNRQENALADGRRAVELSSESSAARIALSYALQANFQLEEAREVLRAAVERDPEDALAWARLAELELMFGRLNAAQEAAERAVTLAPGLSRTQMVLGFAALTRIDIDEAKAAFDQAIALDSANSLPRLGLGLAKIRRSDLEGGRHEIEIAAGLDPNDALIRSYLGKAYFEERRDPQAGEQYAIAKELDPNDPTPWFYDAIRLQLDNRPVEALRSLEKSIELNDNRAVYRSRLLLDEDQATRGTSLARIYDDLGFEQRALVEATKSLSEDPANHSAHRFLSDTYADLPRHEIARASELLQAQLLQPININPVQPSAPITDLNVVAGAGPAEAAFNEFTPLFARNDAQVTTSGIVGNNETFGGEGVLTMLYDRTSLSVGGLYSDTDGFRDNNDLKNKVANVYGQTAVTPKLNLQAEYWYRDTDQGDLDLNFDPDQFSPTDRFDVDQKTIRLGGRYAPAPGNDLLLSLIHSDRNEDQLQVSTFDTPGGRFQFDTDIASEGTGYQGEVQHLFRRDAVNVTSGGGAYNIDSSTQSARTITFPDGSKLRQAGIDEHFDQDHYNAYVYGDLKLPRAITWTLGIGYTSFEEDPVDVDEVTPKFGVQWQIADRVRLRAAAMRTVKRSLVVNQTLEPTQVAGFNQFFDDANGTRADRYGIGLDVRLTDDLYTGVEFSKRDLDVSAPAVGPDGSPTVTKDDQEELLYRGYLYWSPLPDWAFSTGITYDRFKSNQSLDVQAPTKVTTFSVPVFARYFNSLGIFGEVGATYVYQEVDRSFVSPLAQGDDSFVVVDAALGYRLPKRYGVLSLEVRNLFDQGFNFQGDNFRTSEPTVSRYVPERTVLGRVTLTF